MLKKRLFIAMGMLLVFLAALLFFAVKQANNLHRDPVVLMNKYYRFKETNPDIAKKALLIILKQDANYLPAVQEYRQWFSSPISINPVTDNDYHSQLVSVYSFPMSRSVGVLEKGKQSRHPERSEGSPAIDSVLNPEIPHYVRDDGVGGRAVTPQTKVITVDALLGHYYSAKKKDAGEARGVMKQLLAQYPNHIQALKEAGFLAIEQGNSIEAIGYFTRVYKLTYRPDIAMQLAYLYDKLNNKPLAYRYFQLATASHDKHESLTAERALTNLSGQQTKGLPTPYFAEFFVSPFSQSRFGLTVVPLYGRVGVEQNNRLQTKEYVFLRRTQDNRSANLGQISQIYEDNVQITGVGVQIAPLKTLPVIGYVEAGQAYDLLYQYRSRWRGDLRGGFMYYQDFGAQPTYVERLSMGHDYYSDWYGDATYFSRYNNNVIGLVKTHQGIRLLQYKSSMVNLYVTGRVLADTKRVFYNNIAEVGPGIAFVPSNRFNLQLRFEHINGVYLPAGAMVNPYSKYYTNQLVQLLFYVKI